jgi:hypothetical protein
MGDVRILLYELDLSGCIQRPLGDVVKKVMNLLKFLFRFISEDFSRKILPHASSRLATKGVAKLENSSSKLWSFIFRTTATCDLQA